MLAISDTPPPAPGLRSRLPTVFVLLTVLVNAMGIGLIIPVMPALLLETGAGTLADAALWGGVLSTAFAVMQFLVGPTVGNLSDRFGRRPILLISLGVMALDYVVMALAGSIWVLLAARVIGGITAATESTSQAYMADTLPPERRGAGFGMVSAAFGMGFVLGPLIGGLLGDLGTRAPFWAAAGLCAVTFMLGWFVLPETVTDANRRPFRWSRANPLGALRNLSHLPGLGRLLVVVFFYQLAFNVYPAIWAFFTQAQFQWDTRMIGISLAVYGISIALVQGVLIRQLLHRLGEAGTAVIGFIFAAMSFAILAVITSGPLALLLTPVSAVAAIVAPAMLAIMSRRTPADAQGELQGIFSSVSALARILAPLLMTGIFAAFTAPGAAITLPGAPFAASMVLILMALALFVTRQRRSEHDRAA